MGIISDVERGKQLGELRCAAKLTQRQVGEAFGIDKAAVSLWERGGSKPARDRLPMLDQLYGANGAVLGLFGFPAPSTSETTDEQVNRAEFTKLRGEVARLAREVALLLHEAGVQLGDDLGSDASRVPHEDDGDDLQEPVSGS